MVSGLPTLLSDLELLSPPDDVLHAHSTPLISHHEPHVVSRTLCAVLHLSVFKTQLKNSFFWEDMPNHHSSLPKITWDLAASLSYLSLLYHRPHHRARYRALTCLSSPPELKPN